MRDSRPARCLRRGIWLLAAASALAGCASVPRRPAFDTPPDTAAERDGPEANPPPGLDLVPDAEPKIEPLRSGGPNKPYRAEGQTYVPMTVDQPFVERGLASWYGKKFHGRRTASGEVYSMYAMTAAHPTLPIPSYARIRNLGNGREVVVRVNDRGPFHSSRIVDLSYTAALKLDLLRGVAMVEIERLTFDDIRSGTWRRASAGPAAAPAAAVTAELPVAASAVGAAAGVAPAAGDAAGRGALPGFWVQLGAFRERAGAQAFQERIGADVGWLAPLLGVFGDAALFRLQAGPYPSRDDAVQAAVRIRAALRLAPMVVERR